MDKVQILTTCRACGGKAYLPTNEVMTSADGRSTSAMFRAMLAQAQAEKHAGSTFVILSTCSSNKETRELLWKRSLE